jgi:DNA-binding NarL/FixJ family response regulator
MMNQTEALTNQCRELAGTMRVTVARTIETNEKLFLLMAEQRALRSRADVRHTSPAIAVPKLTKREVAILRLIAQGRNNSEIAVTLHFALGTIKSHIRDILRKFGVTDRTIAAVEAVRMGLI